MSTRRIAPPHLPPAGATMPDDTQPVPAVRRARREGGLGPWLVRLPMLILTGVLLLLLLLGALFVGAHQMQYASRIYPGVSTYGVDLSGLTYEQVVQTLDEGFTYDEQAVFTFRDGERFWQVTAGELGVAFDLRSTADTAMLQGRGGDLLHNLIQQADMWFRGRTISPIIVYDQTVAERFLAGVAAQINRPVQDATLTLNGAQILSSQSQVGRALDVAATLALLREQILRLEGGAEIPLVINETPPAVWSVAEAEARLRAALAGPLTVYAEADSSGEAGPWVATPEAIATMLVVERVVYGDGSAGYQVRLDPQQFASFLDGVAPTLLTEPLPARFTFDETTRQLVLLQPGVDGRALDAPTTLARIEEALFAPVDPAAPRRVQLAFTYTVPTVNNNATAAELGITELVGEATTYYLGSSAARQANIAEAAARFNGVVISPGEEFSFNEWLGDVSLEAGFEEGLIIVGGRTIRGVGGGVCQVSTTAFQAAFYAGFPILERVPHGYRVGYYEYGEGVGMDATVYSPLVDFRFLNDTPHHLLIETETNRDNATVTFRFYSTSVGREVVKVGPRVENVVPHGDVEYEENADLSPGQTRQVEWAVDGADVTVTRQVWRGGQLEFEDHFFSHYLPWNAVIQVAPGELPAASAGG